MLDAIITYDLPGASDSQRRAFRDVICEEIFSGERRLRTVWRGLVVEDNAKKLKEAILNSVRSHRNLGKAFAKSNLQMILVVADDDGMSIAEHKTKTLESCP